MKFLALAALAAGCGSNGYVHVTMTDDPAAGTVTQLMITVDEVRIHDDGDPSYAAGGDSGAQADGATGKGWVVLCNNEQTFDLLQLTGGKSLPLCGGQQAEVATGRVSQIRLGVKSAQVVVDGVAQDLAVPSGAQSGLKIAFDAELQKDQVLEVKLDFDAQKSLVQQGNGSWSLKPVLRALP